MRVKKFFPKHIRHIYNTMNQSPKVYALSTARDGSKSVRNKNTMIIQGKPLYLHNLLESLQTPEIIDTYLTTDIPIAITDAPKYGYQIIERPKELCRDESTHTETIQHGLYEIERRTGDKVDILVVMLGNTMNMDSDVVKKALNILESESDVDSVITVIKANHFNPIRAYVDNGKGYIDTYMTQEQIIAKTRDKHLADKNSIGNIYFQNGLWILRRNAITMANGIEPFPWLGSTIRYIEQDPRLQEIDDEYQIRLLA